MDIALKEFQERALAQLVRQTRSARRDVAEDPTARQSLMLSSPTGSGKTVIATAWMEAVLRGDETHPGDPEARFLWVSDQPELNEQTRRKILDNSSFFGKDDVVTIDANFDRERFEAGKVYFLNIQKLGKEKYLVTHGDKRQSTVWETVAATVAAHPASFWVVLDEAHRGMTGARHEKEAATIVQKFIKGHPQEIPPVPQIFGISATPERFQALITGTGRTSREHVVKPEEVRESGLLKDTIVLWHPESGAVADWSMLEAAAKQLLDMRERWSSYAEKEKAPRVEPILVVQVADAASGSASGTDLAKAIKIVEGVTGPLSEHEVAHSFQERTSLEVGARTVRYVAPADIQGDDRLRVVFFKRALNTGWDCPRAEVMMSFRAAVDHTAIAQLIGRMVRTPLARRVASDETLNSVGLYLPFYDEDSVTKVIDYLTSPDPEDAFPSEVKRGEETYTAERAEGKEELFALAETLPTYVIERLSKASNVRRLMRLGRALAYDGLDAEAPERFRKKIVEILGSERERLVGDADFQQALAKSQEVDIRRLTVSVIGEGEAESSVGSMALVAENVEDLHAQSARKLGEGLHGAYLKARVGSAESPSPAQVKVELFALLENPDTIGRLETEAGEEFKAAEVPRRAEINELPEARRMVYHRLLRQASSPEPEELFLPDAIQVVEGEDTWPKHLYVAEDGSFSTEPGSGWETDVLEVELARDDVIGWYRNPDRKPWSLSIPYEYNGERPAYPDFLLFRKSGSGILVDILEPHRQNEDDTWAKVRGLATYAQRHGNQFGRIAYIAKLKDTYRALDVNDVDIRTKALSVLNNQHLMQLVETDGVPIG
ncbi:MAG: DEAD/DEAH box helicase family protein [Actinomycetota bacterium]|nr:DEAD/DEAH box helicase family protein [Actinomycetota bacterium]